MFILYISFDIRAGRGFHVCIKSPHVVLSLYENIFERPETHSGRESLIVTLKKLGTARFRKTGPFIRSYRSTWGYNQFTMSLYKKQKLVKSAKHYILHIFISLL